MNYIIFWLCEISKSFCINCFACHLCCENIRALGERKRVHQVLHIVPINRPSQLMAIEVIRGCKQTPASSLTCINTSNCDVSVPDRNHANRLCTLEHMCSFGKKKFSSKWFSWLHWQLSFKLSVSVLDLLRGSIRHKSMNFFQIENKVTRSEQGAWAESSV